MNEILAMGGIQTKICHSAAGNARKILALGGRWTPFML